MTKRTHLPYFFVDPSQLEDGPVTISGDDATHLMRIRRARVGDEVNVSDGAGRVARARIKDIRRTEVDLELIETEFHPRAESDLVVFQGFAKGEKVDQVIKELVELGVESIAIFETSRSVPDLDEEKAARASGRWRRIAREAAKQSHSPYIPVVDGPLGFDELLSRAAQLEVSVVAHPGSASSIDDALATDAKRVGVIVGPEGGFSEEEIGRMAVSGAVPVGLGNRILRTETAAVVVSAIVLYRLGRLRPHS